MDSLYKKKERPSHIFLSESLIDIKVDIRIAEAQGKNVTDVLDIIGTVESYIGDAKDYLDSGEFDLGMERISSSINLLNKARDLLSTLEAQGPGPGIPLFFILIFVVLIAVVVLVLIYLLKKKDLKEKMKNFVSRMKKVKKNISKSEYDIERLQRDKEKAYRMLKVLEKEKSEGLIANEAYLNMKESLERKIKEIDKKLK